MSLTRTKICCIHSPEEVALAAASGADMLGFVSDMPSGPGVIDDVRARDLIRLVPPGVTPVLLTRKQRAEDLVAQARYCGATTLQLVLMPEIEAYAALREALPGARLIQVVHVTGAEALDQAQAAAVQADALLLDSGTLVGDLVELGGTGRTHDWAISAQIVRASPVPVILAGGLNAGNVAAAIHEVGPYAVDLCTGVRSDGVLDAAKLAPFMAAVRAA